MAKAWKRQNADGTTTIIYDDGRIQVWNMATGQKVNESQANPELAAAMKAGDTNAMDEAINYSTQWWNSPMGEDYRQVRQAAADEDVRRFNEAQQRSKEGLDIQRQNAGTSRYSAETSRMDTEARIKDLERRYGLDSSRLALDFNKQAIEYAKTPRSWLDANDWERGGNQAGIPVYMQNLASNLTNTAFGGKGAGTPQMNSLGQTVASYSGNNAVADLDPTKAISAIIKNSPPSETQGMSGRDAATVNLLAEMYKQGAHKVGEGVLESMDQNEIGTMQAVFDRVSPGGGDRFLREYNRSRLPTGSKAYAA